MDKLKEMGKFLEKYNFPKLKQEKTENLNRPITSTEIKTVIKNIPTNKSPGTGGLTDEFYKNLEKRYHLSCLLSTIKLFQKIAWEGNSQTHSMRPPSP